MIKAKGRNTENPAYRRWFIFNACGLFLILGAIMAQGLFPYHWDTFYKYIYGVTAAALLLGCLYFRPAAEKREVRLCFYFCLWALISRFLNGDFLLEDGKLILNIAVTCMFFPLLIAADEKTRSAFLDIVSLAAVLLFSTGSIIGIYTAVTGRNIINPFSEWYICVMTEARLYMYSANPNIVGNWMLITMGLLLYQFFKRKNPVFKVFMLLLIVLNHFGAALASSRSAMLGISVCTGALVLMIALKYLPLRKISFRVSAAVLLALAIIPMTYISFGGTRHVVSLAASGFSARNEAETAETAADRGKDYIQNPSADRPEEEQPDLYEDTRGFSDSGRISIYKSAVESIKREPLRLLRGSMNEHIMDMTNESFPERKSHFHNSLIQALEFTGIPGFIAAAAFMVMLAIRAAVLFFCSDSRADLAVKTLVIILPGLYIFNMLETSIFYKMDFSSVAFFIIAGAVTAYSYEICPPKNKKA